MKPLADYIAALKVAERIPDDYRLFDLDEETDMHIRALLRDLAERLGRAGEAWQQCDSNGAHNADAGAISYRLPPKMPAYHWRPVWIIDAGEKE